MIGKLKIDILKNGDVIIKIISVLLIFYSLSTISCSFCRSEKWGEIQKTDGTTYDVMKSECYDSLFVSFQPDIIPIAIEKEYIPEIIKALSDTTKMKIGEWINDMEENTILFYRLSTQNMNSDYLIIQGEPYGKTGLSISFHFWFLVDIKNDLTFQYYEDSLYIISLSMNKKSFYLKDDKLFLVIISYGKSYFTDEDYYEHPPLPVLIEQFVLTGNHFEECQSYEIFCNQIFEY